MKQDTIQEEICGKPYFDEDEGWEYKCELGECAPKCEDCVFNIRNAKIRLK